jgi:2-polyprenyl-3-methyl-5-hydroxy-6-metoxy-1,4-benzoquinol methylase
MPKKIKYESFKYRFLIAAQGLAQWRANPDLPHWDDFLKELEFNYTKGQASVTWQAGQPGTIEFALDEPRFYFRGDSQQNTERQLEAGMLTVEDPVKLANETYFREAALRVARAAGYQSQDGTNNMDAERFAKERAFHDAWADSERPEHIDVRTANEACTAPEMRFITRRLGDIRGKRLLDVGCGLGEASVYFAMLGADVTSADLSPGMLAATNRLAEANGVRVTPHLSAAEDMQLPVDSRFDIIYAGNLLHHVDIDQTIARLKPHLAPDGMLVTWDPLAYNPAINVYRAMATDVRTPDEHPLTWRDIKLFHKHFAQVNTQYFWLLTLVIFLIMALVQRRDPNKERFWKIVVQEGGKWRWLYRPLEVADKILLALLPPLRLLCWNVVIVAKNPR